MVHCKHCATPNCLDALFCKRCGTILPEEDVREAQARLDALLAEGRKSFDEGRTDEALAVAERVLVSNPSMSTAIALMSEAHARRGEVAQALECAERLVEINPDSEIDRIRRDGLRALLAETLRPAPAPDRRFALLAGVSAFVLVACLGALAARLGNHPTVPTESLSASKEGNPVVIPTVIPPTAPVQKPSNNAANLQPGDVPPVRDGEGDTVEIGSGRPLPLNGTLPVAGNAPDSLVVEPEQPTITGPIGNRGTALPAATNTARPSRSGGDPEPGPMPPAPTAPDSEPGIYNITIRKGSAPPPSRVATGGADAAPDANGAVALVRAATQQFQLGNYAGAAGAYEKALAAGADPLSTNQRLGMAYENLGRKSEASGAYRRAITAGEAMLAAGKGDPERVRSAVETCKAALGGS